MSCDLNASKQWWKIVFYPFISCDHQSSKSVHCEVLCVSNLISHFHTTNSWKRQSANVGNSAAGVQQQDDQRSAALTLNNAGSQIRRLSKRTEEAAVVDVPLQLEVQEVPAHTQMFSVTARAHMHLGRKRKANNGICYWKRLAAWLQSCRFRAWCTEGLHE